MFDVDRHVYNPAQRIVIMFMSSFPGALLLTTLRQEP